MLIKSKIKNYLFLFFLIFFILELFSYFFIKLILIKYSVIYDPKVSQNYEVYLKKRHDILGWDTSSGNDNKRFIDKYGARIDYSSFNLSHYCIDVYGDSFTYGYWEPQKAWASILSELVKCRVRNFGVGGFGSDQAYIKFLNNKNHSEIVFLNHLSENIIRNVNQYRNFIYPSDVYKFKPRFILQDNKLNLISIPKITEQNISDFLLNPHKYLNHEYFIPNGPSGVQYWKFPYTLNVFKSFNHWQIKQKIKRVDAKYSKFYNLNHPSEAIQITYRILIDFYQTSKLKGLKPIITVFPTCRDLMYYSKNKQVPYKNLIDMLEKENLNYIDFSNVLIEKSKKDFDKYYEECSGHYNSQGELIIAETIYKYLKLNNYLN